MKRIPERYELTEKDIKEAITYWLNYSEIDDAHDYDFDIKFKTERVPGMAPAGALTGGQSDWTVEVITATAEKE